MPLEWERTQAASWRGEKKMGGLLAKISTDLRKSVRRNESQAITLKAGFSSETSITILLRWAEIFHL